ncbi:MAG: lipoprotein insertase outer membrane protein LolB [Acidiferrobacterales bacterium]|nr:lipoprotein insertase outer membrane protein LolB [Acidiferrobacterales bacterium]
MNRALIISLALVFMTGCATVETAIESVDLDVYRSHAATVSTIDHWNLRGRISIRAGSKGEIGRLLWVRNGDAHQLEIYGNFGSRRIRIIQDSDGVVLEDTQGRRIIGSNMQAVLEQRTGQSLPVEALIYWLVGAIDPKFGSVNVWDVEGRLISVQQAGWTVSFSKYRDAGGYQLPTRLNLVQDAQTLTSDESGEKIEEIRIVISDWGIE